MRRRKRIDLGPCVRSTPWTDTCACSDLGFCAYHQMAPGTAPKRPSQEIMIQRAKEKYERDKMKREKLEQELKKYKETANSLDIDDNIKKIMYLQGFVDGWFNKIPAYDLDDKMFFEVYGETKESYYDEED